MDPSSSSSSQSPPSSEDPSPPPVGSGGRMMLRRYVHHNRIVTRILTSTSDNNNGDQDQGPRQSINISLGEDPSEIPLGVEQVEGSGYDHVEEGEIIGQELIPYQQGLYDRLEEIQEILFLEEGQEVEGELIIYSESEDDTEEEDTEEEEDEDEDDDEFAAITIPPGDDDTDENMIVLQVRPALIPDPNHPPVDNIPDIIAVKMPKSCDFGTMKFHCSSKMRRCPAHYCLKYGSHLIFDQDTPHLWGMKDGDALEAVNCSEFPQVEGIMQVEVEE